MSPESHRELPAGLRRAVEQICNEVHDEAVLRRAMSQAAGLESSADLVNGHGGPRRPTDDVTPLKNLSARNRRSAMTRIAAAVVVLAGMTGLFTSFSLRGSSEAFAQIQEAVRKIRSVTFQATSQASGQPKRQVRVLVLGADRVRMELADGEYIVHNSKAQESLIVHDQTQSAVVIVGRQPGTTSIGSNLYATLRTMHAKSTEQLPARTIDGREVPGFRIGGERQTIQVWVDPATNLPVFLQGTRQDTDGTEISETAEKFVFDAPLEESLFSTEPPAGYVVETRTYPRDGAASMAPALVLIPQEGLGEARFGMTKEETLAHLGRPESTSTSSNGRETLRFDSRGFWIGFDEYGKLQNISCHAYPREAAPVARTFAGTVSGKFGMAATPEDITEAFGAPSLRDERESRFGKTVTMSYWNLGLEFTFTENSLTEIHASPPKSAVE